MCILLAKVRGMATLGISTNTRLLGTAIIDTDRLIDYSIHLYKQSWSPTKANLIIDRLEACARRYCIKTVVLSRPYEFYQTEAAQYLFAAITKHFKKKGITVITEESKTLYSLCAPEQKKTKKALMEAIVEMFPELDYCRYKELQHTYPYYVKLFEAVAVAILNEQTER